MDPYLEGSEWMSVHHELSSEISRQLAPKVRPKYIVRSSERFVDDIPDDVTVAAGEMYPDASIVRALRDAPVADFSVAMSSPIQIPTVVHSPIPHVTIEIRDVANRELVTAIEVLSPINKRGEGYREYLGKRGRVLHSEAHLLEVDLLRSGKRVPVQRPLPSAPCFVFLSRAERRPMMEVWPIQLGERLPVVPVPLLAGDPDVGLDLQHALTAIYDALGYDLSVDYNRPPVAPLNREAAEWAAEILRKAGLRAASQ
jgi:hypothetical protein